MKQSLLQMCTKPVTVLGTIAIIYSVLFFSHCLLLSKTVYGDGIYYFSFLRSLVVDHDVNFGNEYAHFGISQPKTATGLSANVYAIGPAVLWSPPYIIGHFLLKDNGFSFPIQVLTGITSVGYALVGLILLYRLLLKYFSQSIASLTLLGIALGTNLFFYGAIDTVNSHSLSFCISTIVFTLFLEKRRPLLIGIFIGILALIRSQDMMFLVIFLPSVIPFVEGTIGAGIGFSLQLVVWYVLYGTIFKSPYLDSYHTFDFSHPKILEVLFSPNNGLFFWTPLVAVSSIGLFVKEFPKQLPRLKFVILSLVSLVIISSWSFWWQGASFSGRMFISIMPVFAFGLASLLMKLKEKQRVILIILFTVINMVSMTVYLLTH